MNDPMATLTLVWGQAGQGWRVGGRALALAVGLVGLALVGLGCDGEGGLEGGSAGDATSSVGDAGSAADAVPGGADGAVSGVGGDGQDAMGGADDAGPGGATGDSGGGPLAGSTGLTVGSSACCLAMEGERVVWSEDGDLWMWEPDTDTRTHLVEAAGDQRDPALSGDRLVWADARGGDYDLWTMDLTTGVEAALVEAPGDQTWPTFDGDWLAWVDRRVAPHGDKEADIWLMQLSDPTTARALVADAAQQDHPHLRGHRVVWDDFSADPDGVYLDLASPQENNGDIMGYDIDTDTVFVVADDGSKQLRPAIDGDQIVWLDWRGISPEPKYSEFQVYTRRVGPELVLEPELFVAWSRWDVPGLWQRPSVEDGQVAFIATLEDDPALQTGVFVAPLDGAPATFIAGSAGVLEAVALQAGRVAWLGGGELGLTTLAPGVQD